MPEKNTTLLELTELRAAVGRALNDLLIAEAKMNSVAAQLDLAIIRHPDNETIPSERQP